MIWNLNKSWVVPTIDMTTEIIVHAYDWQVEDAYTDDDHVAIHAWCLDRNSRPVLLRINTFPAFCHIELPFYVRGKPYNWSKPKADRFVEFLAKALKGDAPVRSVFKAAKKTYYYRGQRLFPMVLLCFNTLKAMKHCENFLEGAIKTEDWGYIQCKVWESDISIVRKVLTARKIRFAQWFKVEGSLVEEELRISTLEQEYIVEWDTMDAIPPDISISWKSQPRILGYDIECYSDNKRAMPDKYNAAHVAYMVSCIYQRIGDPKSRKRYGIIFGDCGEIPPDRMENTEIIRVTSEYKMICEFARIIRELDPEILAGYNNLSFDNPYLDARVQRKIKNWPAMGRLIGRVPFLTTKNWKSGAYGHNSINILHIDGRITIDMLPIIKRDYKLDKYDLDTVSHNFLGKGKHDISAPEMFAIYEDLRGAQKIVESLQRDLNANVNLGRDPDFLMAKEEAYHKLEAAKERMTRVMEYCICDSELVIDLIERLNVWIGLVELSNIVGTTIMELFTRGQQVRCLSQLYDLAANMGFVLDKRDISGFKFTGGFVHEPKPGLYENIICLDFASLYPSIIQAFNICYTTLVPPELENVIPDEDCHVIEFEQEETYEPKRLMSQNDEGSDDEDPLEEELTVSKNPVVTRTVRHRFKFMKCPEGLLPRLVRQLVAERRAVQANMKGEKDATVKAAMNARQLALKVSANSFFGFLGVHTGGKMPLIEGAMCITAKGRELIGMVRKYIEDTYGGEQVYGDTDSVMMNLPNQISERTQCDYWGHRLAQEISGIKPGMEDCDGVKWPHGRPGLFLSPLAMEFEKAMRLLCLKKKKYAALLVGKDGSFKRKAIRDADGNVTGYTDEYDMLKKGIVLARRDNCSFLRRLYTEILGKIMDRRPLNEAINLLVDRIQDLLDGRVPYRQLLIVRELGANYKSDSYFMKVFADNLRKAGKIANPGDRLEFLIVEDPKATLLGEKMRLTEQYLERLGTAEEEKIDVGYYLEKALMNPINQLFSVGYKDVISQLSNFNYRPSNRHKPIGLDSPVKLLLKMRERGRDIMQLKDAVSSELQLLLVRRANQAAPRRTVLRIMTESQIRDLGQEASVAKTEETSSLPNTPPLQEDNTFSLVQTPESTHDKRSHSAPTSPTPRISSSLINPGMGYGVRSSNPGLIMPNIGKTKPLRLKVVSSE